MCGRGVLCEGGLIQGCDTSAVYGVHITTLGDEPGQDRDLALRCGEVNGCATIGVCPAHVGARGHHLLQRREIPLGGCGAHQHGPQRATDLCLKIGVGLFDEVLDHVRAPPTNSIVESGDF